MRVTLSGIEIDAVSVGGIETCYQIPSFDVCLDIGRCPPGAEHRGTLLLTHGHIDHAAGLPYYVSLRNLLGRPPPRIYCPAESHESLGNVLRAWTDLQSDTERCELHPVSPGDVLHLRGNTFAKAYRSPHRIACTGYTLVRRVTKLKPELSAESSSSIAERAKRGEEVSLTVDRAEMSFTGDTRIEVVDREPTVREAKVLLIECTFMGSEVSVEKARRGGHVHLDEIAARADLFKNEAILIGHFSRRYRPEAVVAEVERRLPMHLRSRVHLLFGDRIVPPP